MKSFSMKLKILLKTPAEVMRRKGKDLFFTLEQIKFSSSIADSSFLPL